jgi:hypothetical protein
MQRSEERHSDGNLILLNTGNEYYYHEEQDIVERSNSEQPSIGRNPTKLVFPFPYQFEGLQQIEVRGK